MVIWHSQTLSFISVTDKKNIKHQTFCSPGGVRSPSPTKLGMVIEEVRPILGGLRHAPLRLIVLLLAAKKPDFGALSNCNTAFGATRRR